MNKKLIIGSTAFLLVGFIAHQYYTILCSEIALFERFPDIDDKIVIKAHRTMLKRTLKGMYQGVDTDDEAALDSIFLGIVQELS